MASAKEIEVWVREVLRLSPRKVVRIALGKRQVSITVNRKTHQVLTPVSFAQIAQEFLRLGPSCAQEGAQGEH